MIRNLKNNDLKKRLLEVNHLVIEENPYKIKKYLNGFLFYNCNFIKQDIQLALLGYHFIINFNKVMLEKNYYEEYKKTDMIVYKFLYNTQTKLLKEYIVFKNDIEIDTTKLLKILIMLYRILPEIKDEINDNKISDFSEEDKFYKTIFCYINFYEINMHSLIETNNINAKSFLKLLSLSKNVNHTLNNIDEFKIEKLLNNYYN